MMSFVSCQTTKQKEVEVEVYVPEIEFPEFPFIGNYEITENGILVEESYFRELLIFKISYEECLSEYEEKKQTLQEQE